MVCSMATVATSDEGPPVAAPEGMFPPGPWLRTHRLPLIASGGVLMLASLVRVLGGPGQQDAVAGLAPSLADFQHFGAAAAVFPVHTPPQLRPPPTPPHHHPIFPVRSQRPSPPRRRSRHSSPCWTCCRTGTASSTRSLYPRQPTSRPTLGPPPPPHCRPTPSSLTVPPLRQRLLGAGEVRREARKLRLAANDFLCPKGRPSTAEVGGLPLNLIMEPRGTEGGRGYCARLRREGEWGSMAEIIALTEALECPIAVYHRPSGGAVAMALQDTYGANLPGLVRSALFTTPSAAS